MEEQLEPLPPSVPGELARFRDHLLDRTGQGRGPTYWRGVVQQARQDPEGFLIRVAFSIDKDAKSVLNPNAAELAKWRGESESGLVPGNVNHAALSYQVQNELLKEKRKRELDAWVDQPAAIDAIDTDGRAIG